jgi:diaminopimelate epimerase
MSPAREFFLVSAAGNRFALADGFRAPPPGDPAAVARRLAGRVDGLLLLDPAPGGVRMTLYNADGSRAEACGNGLRCIAAVAVEEGHCEPPALMVVTDAGTRRVEVELERGRVARAAAEMGPVELGTPFAFALEGLALEIHPARVGNPHAVIFVPDAESAPLGVIGPAVERHPRFPERANVEVVSRAGGAGIAVRVWERGVGETAACGTGACAAACVSAARLGLAPPIDVRMPGGLLRVAWTDLQGVTLAGPVQREGTIEP